MNMSAFWRLSLLVVCFFVSSALCEESQDSEVYYVDDTACRADVQLALTAMEENSNSGASADSSDRKKRQVNPFFPLGNYLNQGNYAYNYYPYTGAGNSYLSNSYLYPQRLNSLPIYRFFNSFTPVGIVRSSGALVRTYVRFRSAYTDAQTDFRILPLVNVREERTTTVSRTTGASVVAGIYGINNSVVRLQRNGCSLDGYSRATLPCLTVELPSLPFGRVVRRFVYATGFGGPAGFGGPSGFNMP